LIEYTLFGGEILSVVCDSYVFLTSDKRHTVVSLCSEYWCWLSIIPGPGEEGAMLHFSGQIFYDLSELCLRLPGK